MQNLKDISSGDKTIQKIKKKLTLIRKDGSLRDENIIHFPATDHDSGSDW